MQFRAGAAGRERSAADARSRNQSSSPRPRKPRTPARSKSRRPGPEQATWLRDEGMTWAPRSSSWLVVERKLSRIEQRPEEVLGGLGQGRGLLELGRPAREF